MVAIPPLTISHLMAGVVDATLCNFMNLFLSLRECARC